MEVGELFMESILNHRYSSLHLPAMPTYRLCLPTATELEGPRGEDYYRLWAELHITKLSTSMRVRLRQWGLWQVPILFTDFTR